MMDHQDDASVMIASHPLVRVYGINLLSGPNIEKREVPIVRYQHEPYASILRDYDHATTDEPSFEALGLGLHLGARRNPTETRIIFAQQLRESPAPSARFYVTVDTEGTCEVVTVEPRSLAAAPGGLSLPEIARSLLCGFLNRAPDLSDLGEPSSQRDPPSST